MSEPTHKPWVHAICGLTAGFTATILLHPMDVLKIRFQSDAGHHATPNSKPTFGYTSTLHAVRSIYQHEGLRGFYGGLFPSVLGSSVAWGMYFWGYNLAKTAYRTHLYDGDMSAVLSWHENLSASAVAGLCTQLVTNPIWVIKTNMQLQVRRRSQAHATQAHASSAAHEYHFRDSFDAVSKIVRRHGISGLFRGLTPSLFGVSHGAIQFMIYEEFRRRVLLQEDHVDVLADWETVLVSSSSKLLAMLVTYPYQVVRTRLQHFTHGHQPSGPMEVISSVYRHSGLSGFYRGLFMGCARVLPSSVVTFVVYERLKILWTQLEEG